LAISSKIANELLAKLLDDLRASKEESLATLTGGCSLTYFGLLLVLLLLLLLLLLFDNSHSRTITDAERVGTACSGVIIY
jgi:hypothetical protein